MTTSDDVCDQTRDDSQQQLSPPRPKRPGVVVVLEAGEAASVALEIPPRGLELGRGSPRGHFTADDRISRSHVTISGSPADPTASTDRHGARFVVTDRESRNGTFVDGRALSGSIVCDPSTLIRIGRSLLWTVDDVAPFAGRASLGAGGGPVLGGRTRRAWGEIALLARVGDTLCLRGESGSGKELAARAFHEARHAQASAPFVALNCAAIPEGVAERLLFGARKGAFSGATADVEGYVQAADRGTLFLDEIAELDPLVQAKLLRVLESREVLQLGATRPRKVELAVCVASFKSLRDEVAAGRFREDLYFRIGRPEVFLPPLRERVDELPVLIARALLEVDTRLTASVLFVEACALRAWPGNVRELFGEVRRAGHAALSENTLVVEPSHLAADAGLPLPAALRPEASSSPSSSAPPPGSTPPAAMPSDEEVMRALEVHGGNVRGTARALGVHRNQLRRWLEKHGPSGKPAAGPEVEAGGSARERNHDD